MAKSKPGLVCSFDSCERDVYCKNLCQRHYEQQNEGKPLTPIRGKRKTQPESCEVEGCSRIPRRRGMCNMHNYRVDQYGDPGGPDSWRRTACQVEGCIRKHQAHGYCATHLRRFQLYGDHDGAQQPQKCKKDGCTNTSLGSHTKSKGYCGRCYVAQWLDSYLDKEIVAKRYPNGYEYFDLNRQRYGVHRLVMERLIGRELFEFENVHHKNGIRHDNAPSNLELWVTPQPTGQRPEDLVAWVVYHYPDLVAAELKARRREQRTGQARLV